ATDDRGDVAAADLLVPDELDLGGLHHRVGGLDHSDEALRFDESQSVSHDFSRSFLKANGLLTTCYLSMNLVASLPVSASSALIAACAAESISDSRPER